jgi:hypothetical protein
LIKPRSANDGITEATEVTPAKIIAENHYKIGRRVRGICADEISMKDNETDDENKF